MDNWTSSDLEEWDALIQRVAKRAVREYPNLEKDDVVSELWIILYEKKEDLTELGMQSTESARAYGVLWFGAQRYAEKERKEHLILSPQYAYRTSDVRKLFQDYFNKGGWLNAHVPEDAESELGPVQFELMGDIGRAWKLLPENYRALIIRGVAKDDMTLHEQKKLSRAYARAADILNTYQPSYLHEGPGRRRTMSNAQAVTMLGQNEVWFAHEWAHGTNRGD